MAWISWNIFLFLPRISSFQSRFICRRNFPAEQEKEDADVGPGHPALNLCIACIYEH